MLSVRRVWAAGIDRKHSARSRSTRHVRDRSAIRVGAFAALSADAQMDTGKLFVYRGPGASEACVQHTLNGLRQETPAEVSAPL